ncbi:MULTISPECIES: MarR family winged helix-turn-helix transcriptional regulator [Asticcacaulis]|uniref:bifunctional helix-turn-helix transcriptional regulator/GNAT family N-acetyltransferase n=1 Tax=Asticcacaulis TaxID=76890 RepID=UPI00285E7D79|nr:MarR family winged helix-turn-helix transcriptional regulator [Asticcacaulis sp. BE141]MBP2157863.1 DNA-binding MarR family transcriptional regulator/GNAT superfamily N-acetyltransferase [Asticcacaulis solisilvae]MDR6798908.1 DNA-binding MarR family transcriptional regulator/GNAT superfamily N-acetyltransferase [Asticcacaulis sp. BE141]
MLDSSYLGQGRPLGEARLLFEISDDGCDVRTLRDRLGLDSGYVSRLLRSLEREGLIQVAPSQEDRRMRRAEWTAAGRETVATYDRLSDDRAQGILAPLDADQRDRLVSAMAEVERLLRAAAITVTVEQPDSPAALACLKAYGAGLAEVFEGGYDASNDGPPDHDDYRQPRGAFLVAWSEGLAVGCGAWKRLDATTAEIKRLWTAGDVRGLGLGRRLLRTLEDLARDAGMTQVQLDTNRVLGAAQALYRSEGYKEIPRYNDSPYAHMWFRKDL